MASVTTDNSQSNNASIKIDPVEVKVTAEKTTHASTAPPPLVNFQLTNPIVYIKAWWKKLIGNEGIKMTLQIKPVTAVILVAIFCGAGFGFGRLTVPQILVPYLPTTNASPTPISSSELWKNTAFTGKVQLSGSTYFLVTSSDEAITLEVPNAINLKPLIGKRLLVVGRYNKTTRYLVVSDITDMEILPATPIPLPTVTPSPIPESIKSN